MPRARPAQETRTRIQAIVAGDSPTLSAVALPALLALQHGAAATVCAFVGRPDPASTPQRQAFPDAAGVQSVDDVDAAPGSLLVIAGSTRGRPALVNAAVRRGWHVLCEAPLAANTHEARQMLSAAQRQERLLIVDTHRRRYPAVTYIKGLCRDHLLGPPVSFEVHDGSPTQIDELKPDGVLTEIGVPMLDLITVWFGRGTLVRYADDALGGVEANASLELAHRENVRGTVHLSRDWPTSTTCEIVFERATVRWNTTDADRLQVELASAPSALDAAVVEPASPSQGDAEPLAASVRCYLAQLAHVMSAIRGGTDPGTSVAEALHTLELVDDCHARRTLLPQPWLSHNEAACARSLSTPTLLRQ